MADDLRIVVELQKALDDLHNAEELLAGIPDWMSELHGEHSEQKALISSLEAEVDEANQAHRTAEGEIGNLREKVKHFQEQIGMVRNQAVAGDRHRKATDRPGRRTGPGLDRAL
jgi:predicted  nucleic acid-binding Zn-ribbon protein